MRRILSGRLILYLFFILILDICFMPMIRVGWVRPVLSYLMVVHASLKWGWQRTWGLALLMGIIREPVGVQPIGVEMTALVTAALVLDFSAHKFEHKSAVIQAVMAYCFVLCVCVFSAILEVMIVPDRTLEWHPVTAGIKTALYTAALCPAFFYFTARWFEDRPRTRQFELFDYSQN